MTMELTEKQIETLKGTTLTNGMNAWEIVL